MKVGETILPPNEITQSLPMDAETKDKLHRLRIYLHHLPDCLPFKPMAESNYGFHSFSTEQEDEEDIGLEGAINRQLEIRLGHRNNGLVLKERGPGLVSIVLVLENYLNQLPTSVILQKWVDDLISAARQLFKQGNHPVSVIHEPIHALYLRRGT